MGKISISIPDGVIAEIKQVAKQKNMTASGVAQIAFELYLGHRTIEGVMQAQMKMTEQTHEALLFSMLSLAQMFSEGESVEQVLDEKLGTKRLAGMLDELNAIKEFHKDGHDFMAEGVREALKLAQRA